VATEVFAAWERGDKIASDILAGAAATLAKDAVCCAGRLASPKRPVQFVLRVAFCSATRFAREVTRRLRQLRPNCRVTPLPRESVWARLSSPKGWRRTRAVTRVARTECRAPPLRRT